MPEIPGIVGVVFPKGEAPRVVMFTTAGEAQATADKLHRSGKYARILLAKPYVELTPVAPGTVQRILERTKPA